MALIDEEDLESYVTKDGQRVWNVPPPIEDEDDEMPTGDAATSSNDFRTSFERLSNDIRTVFERYSNELRTTDDNKSNQVALANKRRDELEPELPEDYLELYYGVAECLNNREFVKSAIGGDNKNFFSVPKPLRVAINQKLGTNYKRHTVDKVWYSLSYCKEVKSKQSWRTFSITLITVIMLAVGGWYYIRIIKNPIAADPETKGATLEAGAKATREKDSIYILSWSEKNQYIFYPFRYGVMLDNPNFVNGSDAEREKILQQQRIEQNKAISKKLKQKQ